MRIRAIDVDCGSKLSEFFRNRRDRSRFSSSWVNIDPAMPSALMSMSVSLFDVQPGSDRSIHLEYHPELNEDGSACRVNVEAWQDTHPKELRFQVLLLQDSKDTVNELVSAAVSAGMLEIKRANEGLAKVNADLSVKVDRFKGLMKKKAVQVYKIDLHDCVDADDMREKMADGLRTAAKFSSQAEQDYAVVIQFGASKDEKPSPSRDIAAKWLTVNSYRFDQGEKHGHGPNTFIHRISCRKPSKPAVAQQESD